MDSHTLSIAERRRLEKLAQGVPATQWIVVPFDPDASILSIAGQASRGPLYALVGPNPVSAIARLQTAGLRYRAHLAVGTAAAAPKDWTQPIGLLCLPAADPNLNAVMATWGRHVAVGGHVLFYGGLAPHAALRLSPGYWIEHLREGGGLFLLTRRPHG